MFFVCLLLALFVILILIFKHARSKYKRLSTLTCFMIMAGMICWGYHDINLATGYPSTLYENKVVYNNKVIDAVVNEPLIDTIGMFLLILSIPCVLLCILSKPQKIEEIDKLLEDQDDID